MMALVPAAILTCCLGFILQPLLQLCIASPIVANNILQVQVVTANILKRQSLKLYTCNMIQGGLFFLP